MHFLYVFYYENVLYMFRTGKLFILRRNFLLYIQILVRIALKDVKNC
jgi:hypothetical protein